MTYLDACAYPNCECAIEFPLDHKPSEATECPQSASPAVPSSRATARYGRIQCRECGTGFQRYTRSDNFCSTTCRRTFNNRRAMRGAELYDLFMVIRFDRPRAKLLGLWTIVCYLAGMFRDEDNAERDGRPSWRDPAEIIGDKPFLKAELIARRHRVGR